MRVPSSTLSRSVEPEGSAGCSAPNRAPRVLIVDDDPDVRRMLADYLEREGMVVTLAGSGRDMLMRLDASPAFSLVILDLRLGNEDGLDLLRRLRARTDTPVVIITGHRRDERERVLGLELGADDYVVKPFALRELLARIRSVLRRQRSTAMPASRSPTPHVSAFEGWRLDRDARRLSDPDGHDVPLTQGEYSTLLALVERAGRVVSREALLCATGADEDRFDRSVDVQILRLRRKLEADPTAPRFIKTERGQGYIFAVPVETTR